ncbi:mercuric reductase (plasmid) [Deinococcus sp. KNUC1210]|uniref:mercuric reductase n=1 Tax=Deinococcus sp. KNUC1210 TaxID=2917691 RepID=UPI001EF14C78|nr:mercuric reductase [Deinococcus sp. KNUC1210]ULH14212.1 mercuric reductase [Deinococcus sp. KNUC1210]
MTTPTHAPSGSSSLAPEPQSFDAVVIGSGQAGGPLAGALSKAGWRVALVERVHVGGTCVNEGCTPTKTLIASARVAHLARRAHEYGLEVGEVRVEMPRVVARKQAVVDSFRNGSTSSVLAAGVELIRGEASFTGSHTLQVELTEGGSRQLTAPNIFINTGASPSRATVPGLDRVGALDSTSIMEVQEVPTHLMIQGGGFIGLEFAQLFARLGSAVTVLERGPRLAAREDADVAAALQEALEADGVRFLLQTEVTAATRDDSGITLSLKGPHEEQLVGSHLLVAVGRTPNTAALNLSAAGIETDGHGFIQVNDTLHTNVEGIYALGDVKGGPAFTHISYDDFRIVRDHLLSNGERTTENRPVPYTVFTDPQLGRIGLDEGGARKLDRPTRVYSMPMSYVARAIELGETRGLMRAVVDDETDLLLGATVLGIEGGELLSVLQMAMMGGVSASTLREAVFSHPTLTESLNNLFSSEPLNIMGQAHTS